jgi:hypothetical protein
VYCNHVWKSFETNLSTGGYMLFKFCYSCKSTQGLGFIDKEHEINYLESILEDQDRVPYER